MNLAVYLNYNDNTNQALEYYKEIFDAEELLKLVYTDEMTEDKEKIGKVLHAELKINNQLNLYFSDSFKDYKREGFAIVVEVDSLEEAKDLYAKLSQDGEEIAPLEELDVVPTIVGSVRDKFGLAWDIITESK
jgi:PhnB protein